MYALKHNASGKYVAKLGSEPTYTREIECVRLFKTREEAEKERCVESEHVVFLN